jgi:hypothetical protein
LLEGRQHQIKRGRKFSRHAADNLRFCAEPQFL